MDPLCGVPEILLATDALLSAAVGVSGKFGGGDDVGVLGTADPCRWSIVRPPSRVLDAALCRSVSNCTRHEDRGGASIDETRRRAQHAHRLETARAWGAKVKHAGWRRAVGERGWVKPRLDHRRSARQLLGHRVRAKSFGAAQDRSTGSPESRHPIRRRVRGGRLIQAGSCATTGEAAKLTTAQQSNEVIDRRRICHALPCGLLVGACARVLLEHACGHVRFGAHAHVKARERQLRTHSRTMRRARHHRRFFLGPAFTMRGGARQQLGRRGD